MQPSVTTATTDDAQTGCASRLPGDKDVWIFIIGELLMFSAFFLTYIVSRGQNAELYDSSQVLLDLRLGTLNPLFLVTSSWAVAFAVATAHRGRIARASHSVGGESNRSLLLARGRSHLAADVPTHLSTALKP